MESHASRPHQMQQICAATTETTLHQKGILGLVLTDNPEAVDGRGDRVEDQHHSCDDWLGVKVSGGW